MRKIITLNEDDSTALRRPRSPALVFLVALLLSAPLAYEGGVMVAARWSTLLGTPWFPETPVLDTIAGVLGVAGHTLGELDRRAFQGGSWSPSTAMAMVIFWALIAMALLRKTD